VIPDGDRGTCICSIVDIGSVLYPMEVSVIVLLIGTVADVVDPKIRKPDNKK
jgi:hypothetical protein